MSKGYDLLWDVDGKEQEQRRLADRFQAHLKPPPSPPSADTTTIIRYIHDTPSLKYFAKDGLERFLANVGVLPDGRLICTIASSMVAAEKGFYPFVWGSRFGSCLRLLLPTERQIQAVVIPGEATFDALQSNRLIFVVFRLGRVHTITEYDLTLSPETTSTFKQLCELSSHDHVAIMAEEDSYFDADLILANSVSAKPFSKHWTRLEWLQRGWVDASESRYKASISSVQEARAEITEAVKNPLINKFKLLHATSRTLANDQLSKTSQIKDVIARFKTYPTATLINECFALDNELLALGSSVT
jgi:hypothetical protein